MGTRTRETVYTRVPVAGMLICQTSILATDDTCYLCSSVQTLWTQDSSDPRQLGTSAKVSIIHIGISAELSGHIGASAEAEESYRHFGTKEDTSAQATVSKTVLAFCVIVQRNASMTMRPAVCRRRLIAA